MNSWNGLEMFMPAYYKSKKWLTRKYITERLTETKIAEICGTTQVTINKWLRKFNLKR